MASKGTSIEMLNKVISENQIILTYEKALEPTTPAKVSGTIALTITLNDDMLFAIHSAVGQGALGIDPPPMPDSWWGCTTTTEMRGDLVGAQTAPGGRVRDTDGSARSARVCGCPTPPSPVRRAGRRPSSRPSPGSFPRSPRPRAW
jgi:hypothetical protein